MAKFLLDYVFPINLVVGTAQASTGFLKRVCVVAKPKSGQEGNVGQMFSCEAMADVLARTNNTNAQRLFNAGMNQIYLLLADDLDLAEAMEENAGEFWTVLISSDFQDAEVLGEGDIVITEGVQAAVKVGDITYTAVPEGVLGNVVSITYEDELAKEVKSSAKIKDLLFTSKLVGVLGDDITIEIEDDMGKDNASATVSVAGSAITIDIEDGATTAETIRLAIVGSSEANALVLATVDPGDQTVPQDVTGSAVSLEGGADAEDGKGDGTAIARVEGNQVIVDIDDGVTTALAIKTAVDSEASTLVTCAIDAGDDNDAQDVTDGQELLVGGIDEVTQPGGDGGLDVGIFDGVVGFSSTNRLSAKAFAIQTNRCGFFTSVSQKGNNMFHAFGKLLSNPADWTNQQYVETPVSDGVDSLGLANLLFDDKVSFVISDDEFFNRLALFAAGSKAIVAPYILKNLRIDMQSRALNWISLNQPQYTLKNASLLEARLQEDVLQRRYIDRNWIESGSVEIRLIEDNFVANGTIEVIEPRALWRVFNNMTAI